MRPVSLTYALSLVLVSRLLISICGDIPCVSRIVIEPKARQSTGVCQVLLLVIVHSSLADTMVLMNCFARYAFYDRHAHDYVVDGSFSVDILSLLPTELALHILMLLCTPLSPPASPALDSTDLETHPYPVPDPDSLRSILACLSVSRKWRTLASDNSVWQALFLGRWAIDLRRANRPHKLIRQRCNKTARVDCKQLHRTISSDQRLLNKGCMSQRTTNELPPLQPLPLSDFPPQRITSVHNFFLVLLTHSMLPDRI